MNSSQQKSFMAAAECLNFTAAADKLYISQPVLSRNIAALEAEFGVLLFVRKNNTLQLTPAGEIMYQWMKESQISLNDALIRAREANLEPQGELRLGFVESEITTEREARTILEFQKAYPQIRLSIVRSSAQELLRQLLNHSLDLANMGDTELSTDPRFHHVECDRYSHCIAISRAHPLADFEPISLKAFANETFISVRPEYSPVMTPWIRKVCGAAGFVPRIQEAANTTEQMALVEAQRGVALAVDNHASQSNPLLKQLRLKEDYSVPFRCNWDKQGTNPRNGKYLEILKEFQKK